MIDPVQVLLFLLSVAGWVTGIVLAEDERRGRVVLGWVVAALSFVPFLFMLSM